MPSQKQDLRGPRIFVRFNGISACLRVLEILPFTNGALAVIVEYCMVCVSCIWLDALSPSSRGDGGWIKEIGEVFIYSGGI